MDLIQKNSKKKSKNAEKIKNEIIQIKKKKMKI